MINRKCFLPALMISILLVLLAACRSPDPGPYPTPSPSPAQEQEILADSFFFGCAYLDANQNDRIDDGDEPVKDAVFLVKLPVGGMTARTGSDGCVTVVIPGGVDRSAWPLETSMEPPPDSDLEVISPDPLILEYQNSSADFLFQEIAGD